MTPAAAAALTRIAIDLLSELGPLHPLVARYCLSCQVNRMQSCGFEDHVYDYNARWLALAAVIDAHNCSQLVVAARLRARNDGDARAEKLLEEWLATYFPQLLYPA